MHVSRAGHEDDEEIRALLRARSMEGLIRLSLTREPDARIGAGIEGNRHATTLIREKAEGPLLGMGSRSVRSVYFDGNVVRMGYLGGLRAADGRRALRRIRAGFEDLNRTRQEDELPFDLTSIVEDNAVARRLLERGLPGLPAYEVLTGFTTYLIPTRAMRRPSGTFAIGTADQVPAIADRLQRHYARYQFAPVWEAGDLRSPTACPGLEPSDFIVLGDSGGVRSCAAVWDQRAFKQVRVTGYAPWLARCRPLVNTGLRLRRRPLLPSPGSALALAYLSHLAVEDEDPETFLCLLQEARHRAAVRGIDLLVAGFADAHPLRAVLESRMPARSYRSVLYRVGPSGVLDDGPKQDARTIHVEVATL